jgi:hypothetical protein
VRGRFRIARRSGSGDLLKYLVLDDLLIPMISSDEVIDDHLDPVSVDLLVGILIADDWNFRRIERRPPQTPS